MALKALLCFGNDALPQHQSILRDIHIHPQQPPTLYPLARGIVDHSFDALDWSARPHVGH
jgi:hypothetical protein